MSAAAASAPLPFGARKLLAEIGIPDGPEWVAATAGLHAVRRRLPDGRVCEFLRSTDGKGVVMAVEEVDDRFDSWTLPESWPSLLLGPYHALFRGWRKAGCERR